MQKLISNLVLLSSALLLMQSSVLAASKNCHSFDQYPVAHEFAGPFKGANIEQLKKTYKLWWKVSGAALPPNFAGHLRMSGYACGTECSVYYVVDTETGQTFFKVPQAVFGMKTEVNSRLVIVDGPETLKESFQGGDIPKEGSTEGYGYRTRYLVWDEDKKEFNELAACPAATSDK